ncbi:hypothetical protein [Photorhabdus khanii]|nr:hypothetical protein [Photorhabdus khanii]
MSRQELLSALVKAGIANADDAAPSIDESEGGKRGQVTRGNRDGNAV